MHLWVDLGRGLCWDARSMVAQSPKLLQPVDAAAIEVLHPTDHNLQGTALLDCDASFLLQLTTVSDNKQF